MRPQVSGQVLVRTATDRVLVRVNGRATHLVSQPLREFVGRMIQLGHGRFEIDLKDCVHLDSTFAGMLVGVSMQLRELGGSLTLLRVPPRCADLLVVLGVDRFFITDLRQSDSVPGGVPMTPLPAGHSLEAWATTVIEAHHHLIDADEKNAPRFRDLLEVLAEDLFSSQPLVTGEPALRADRWKQ